MRRARAIAPDAPRSECTNRNAAVAKRVLRPQLRLGVGEELAGVDPGAGGRQRQPQLVGTGEVAGAGTQEVERGDRRVSERLLQGARVQGELAQIRSRRLFEALARRRCTVCRMDQDPLRNGAQLPWR